MNFKTLFYITLALLIGALVWAFNMKSEPGDSGQDDSQICGNGMMSVSLDTLIAHERIKTYRHFLNNMESLRASPEAFDYENTMVGNGDFSVTFKSVYEHHQKSFGFKVENPCEFNNILKNAVHKDSIYVFMAVTENPETREGKLDIIYGYKTNKPKGTKTIDSKGFAYDDKHCDCPSDCCPPVCFPPWCF